MLTSTNRHLPVTSHVRLLLHRGRGLGNTRLLVKLATYWSDRAMVLVHSERWASDLRHQLKVAGAGPGIRVLAVGADLARHLMGQPHDTPTLVDLPVLDLVAQEATNAAVAADQAERTCQRLRETLARMEAELAQAHRALAKARALVDQARGPKKVRARCLLRRLSKALSC